MAEVRRRVSQFAEGATPVLKEDAAQQPILRLWSMTIADLYFSNQPQGAADRVRAWAAAVCREL